MSQDSLSVLFTFLVFRQVLRNLRMGMIKNGISLYYLNSFQVTTPKSHTDLLSKLILMIPAGNSVRLIFNFVQL